MSLKNFMHSLGRFTQDTFLAHAIVAHESPLPSSRVFFSHLINQKNNYWQRNNFQVLDYFEKKFSPIFSDHNSSEEKKDFLNSISDNSIREENIIDNKNDYFQDLISFINKEETKKYIQEKNEIFSPWTLNFQKSSFHIVLHLLEHFHDTEASNENDFSFLYDFFDRIKKVTSIHPEEISLPFNAFESVSLNDFLDRNEFYIYNNNLSEFLYTNIHNNPFSKLLKNHDNSELYSFINTYLDDQLLESLLELLPDDVNSFRIIERIIQIPHFRSSFLGPIIKYILTLNENNLSKYHANVQLLIISLLEKYFSIDNIQNAVFIDTLFSLPTSKLKTEIIQWLKVFFQKNLTKSLPWQWQLFDNFSQNLIFYFIREEDYKNLDEYLTYLTTITEGPQRTQRLYNFLFLLPTKKVLHYYDRIQKMFFQNKEELFSFYILNNIEHNISLIKKYDFLIKEIICDILSLKKPHLDPNPLFRKLFTFLDKNSFNVFSFVSYEDNSSFESFFSLLKENFKDQITPLQEHIPLFFSKTSNSLEEFKQLSFINSFHLFLTQKDGFPHLNKHFTNDALFFMKTYRENEAVMQNSFRYLSLAQIHAFVFLFYWNLPLQYQATAPESLSNALLKRLFELFPLLSSKDSYEYQLFSQSIFQIFEHTKTVYNPEHILLFKLLLEENLRPKQITKLILKIQNQQIQESFLAQYYFYNFQSFENFKNDLFFKNSLKNWPKISSLISSHQNLADAQIQENLSIIAKQISFPSPIFTNGHFENITSYLEIGQTVSLDKNPTQNCSNTLTNIILRKDE